MEKKPNEGRRGVKKGEFGGGKFETLCVCFDVRKVGPRVIVFARAAGREKQN